MDEGLLGNCGAAASAQVPAEASLSSCEPGSQRGGERRKLNSDEAAQRKKLKKLYKNYPSFVLNSNAYKTPISTKDIRKLYTFILGAGGSAQTWILAKNQSKICRVILLQIPCLRTDIFYDAKCGSPVPIGEMSDPLGLLIQLPILKTIFSIACPCSGPREHDRLCDPFRSLSEVPLTKGEKRQRAAAAEAAAARVSQSSVLSYDCYQLTLADMLAHGYPIPSVMDQKSVLPLGFVETRPVMPGAGIDQLTTKIIGLDCEMCETSEGLELARVTMVDKEGATIYDKFVKPDNDIIDYLTRWSGVTPEHMAKTTTTLRDVQEDILKIVDHSVILVGHSLECDLAALKLAHPRIIDTAVLFPPLDGSWRKSSLKTLAYVLLGRRIQSEEGNGGRVGHCSAEDALACVDLLKAKAKYGPNFGRQARDVEPVFVRLKTLKPPKISAVFDTAETLSGIDDLDRPDITAACRDDDEVLAKLLDTFETGEERSPSLVFAQFKEVERLYEDDAAACSENDIPEQPTIERIAEVYQQTNTRLAKLWAAMPPCTAFIVGSFGEDPRCARRLAQRKRLSKLAWNLSSSGHVPKLTAANISEAEAMDECSGGGIVADAKRTTPQSPPAPKQWTQEDEELLEKAIESARRGVAFFTVK